MGNGDFEYEFRDDGTVEITKYMGSATSVDIPGEIDRSPVTSIGIWAFYGCEALQEIRIPESVTEIDAAAFDDGVILIVAPGSYAEEYAKKYGRKYILKLK